MEDDYKFDEARYVVQVVRVSDSVLLMSQPVDLNPCDGLNLEKQIARAALVDEIRSVMTREEF